MGGMRVADVIVKVDGQSVKNIYALHNTLIKNKSGKEIKVEVSRKIKNIRKDITLSITLSWKKSCTHQLACSSFFIG